MLAAFALNTLTIISSALVAILVSILKFAKFEEHWLHYRGICENLKKEEHYYKFQTGPYAQAATPEKAFVERVESLISKEHTVWSGVVKAKKGK